MDYLDSKGEGESGAKQTLLNFKRRKGNLIIPHPQSPLYKTAHFILYDGRNMNPLNIRSFLVYYK